MSYILANTTKKVKWYKFDFPTNKENPTYELLDILDLQQVPMFSDKQTAKAAALALGLKTWRYVKIS